MATPTTPGLETQPSAVTYDVEDLIQKAWSGYIRVPHFQRDYRWGIQDVIRLFDSIIKGYPIGSLLLWVRDSPREKITLGALSIDAPRSDNVLWVVDGQQRITSLANSLHPEGSKDPSFSVYYDLAAREFIPRPKIQEPEHVPLHILFDLEELLNWFSGGGSPVSRYFAEATRVAKLLRQFKVPAYLVRQNDERVLTDIFDRMNNYGKRLSRAEIFSALFAGPEDSASERLSFPRIAEEVDQLTGFGTIDSNTVLHAILARRGADPMRDIRSEFDDTRRGTEFPGEDQEVAYAEGEKALVRAIHFLQESAGVPHFSFLTYKALLVVLTRFFAHFPDPHPRHVQLLRRFYWRASVSGPSVFKGSFTQMSRALCSLIFPGDEERSVRGLVRSMSSVGPIMPDPRRFRTNEAVGKIVLCSWWALQPLSPFTEQAYDRRDLTDLLAGQSTPALAVHRILPRGLTADQQLWAANRLFVPSEADSAEAILEVITQPHLFSSSTVWESVLDSYCINERAARHLEQGEQESFMKVRQEQVTTNLQNFLKKKAEWHREDTPALNSLDFDFPEE